MGVNYHQIPSLICLHSILGSYLSQVCNFSFALDGLGPHRKKREKPMSQLGILLKFRNKGNSKGDDRNPKLELVHTRIGFDRNKK